MSFNDTETEDDVAEYCTTCRYVEEHALYLSLKVKARRHLGHCDIATMQ